MAFKPPRRRSASPSIASSTISRNLPAVVKNLPAVMTIEHDPATYGGRASAQLGFMDGTDGKPRLAWARSEIPFAGGWGFGSGGNPYMSYPGARASREASLAADVTNELLTSNPIIATVVESLATNAIGTGLTPSCKPDAEALGLTKDQARALSSDIERKWAAWAGNPRECDLAGRHNFHALATAGYKSYLINGELLATIDARKCEGAKTLTKVAILDNRQLDRSRNRTDANGGTFQGVAFDKVGRVTGYWIRPYVAGQLNAAPLPVYVPAFTSWGRAKVVFLFDLALPGQVRGFSPLTAALSPAHERESLSEFTLAAALNQTAFSMTIESDLPPRAALEGLNPDNGAGMAGWADQQAGFYEKARITPQPGVINHLALGDKLKINRSDTPNSTFAAFDSSLTRKAAKAAGSSYEDASGDYSATSFSASRMAAEMPHRINLRRRAQIAEQFYQLVFSAWLEEQIERGFIALPAGAPEFWRMPEAYTAAKWIGPGKVSPDRHKDAKADVLMLENHLTTHTEILARDGLDFDEVLAQRKHELEALRDAGLLGEPTDPGDVTTQIRDTTAEPTPAPQASKKKSL